MKILKFDECYTEIYTVGLEAELSLMSLHPFTVAFKDAVTMLAHVKFHSLRGVY